MKHLYLKLCTMGGMSYGSLVGYAYMFPDETYQAMLTHWTQPRHLQKSNRFFGFGGRSVDNDTRRCIDCMTSLLAFNFEAAALERNMSPYVVFADTLMVLDGFSETRDAWHFLEFFFRATDPVLTEVRQSTVDRNEYHLKYSTDAVLRFIPIGYTFESAVQLNLEDGPMGKRINEVQHRWYGGTLASRRAGSVDSIVGDCGDLARRWAGFWLASFLTISHAGQESAAPASSESAN